VGISVIITFFAYWKIDHTTIVTSVLVGSITAAINFGILIKDFPSLEMRKKLRPDRY